MIDSDIQTESDGAKIKPLRMEKLMELDDFINKMKWDLLKSLFVM